MQSLCKDVKLENNLKWGPQGLPGTQKEEIQEFVSQGSSETQNQQHRGTATEVALQILRNVLICVWGWQDQTCQRRVDAAATFLEEEFFLPPATLVLHLKSFHGLDVTHSCYRGSSACTQSANVTINYK